MKWEYKTMFLSTKNTEDTAVGRDSLQRVLNELGNSEWELVSCIYKHDDYRTIAFFKRPVPSR